MSLVAHRIFIFFLGGNTGASAKSDIIIFRFSSLFPTPTHTAAKSSPQPEPTATKLPVANLGTLEHTLHPSGLIGICVPGVEFWFLLCVCCRMMCPTGAVCGWGG
ncbi:unnamed protein product [Pylaiella littoralis]